VVKPKPEIIAQPKLAGADIKPRAVEMGTAESKLKSDSKANAPAQTQTIPKEPVQKTEKPTGEQLALLTKKPSEIPSEIKPPVRAAPRALEGYVIQLAFSDKGEAQRWAENLTGRGYAVSVTEAGAGAFRVRVGNFPGRSEAERQLKTLSQNGLKGIVINLPQAYRPEVRSAAPDAAGQTISVTP
jgi:cell division septation protein DedD